MIESMRHGSLYVCKSELRLKGKLADGRDAFSLVPPSTPVMPIRNESGDECLLIEGATIKYNWQSAAWPYLFEEVQGG
jgi:hypothetical protein